MVVFEGVAYLHNVLQSEFKCENLNGGCSIDVTVPDILCPEEQRRKFIGASD